MPLAKNLSATNKTLLKFKIKSERKYLPTNFICCLKYCDIGLITFGTMDCPFIYSCPNYEL